MILCFLTARTKTLYAALLLCVAFAAPSFAQNMPPGFINSKVAAIEWPTCLAFAPDGRIFVCHQRGQVRVVKNGVLLPTPFVTLNVDYNIERGVIGITFDSDFTTNHYVYIFYTSAETPIRNRISRFTANGDVAVAGSEVILLEIPVTANIHNGGSLRFGPDGKFYIAVGDGGTGTNAQALDNLKGKILRLNKDGTVPTDNPFYQTTTGINRAIWCYGLRNPYTFAFQPGTGRMYINDVGGAEWEEVNNGIAGANYGWPLSEGRTTDPRFVSPVYTYSHFYGSFVGVAITGGDFYNPPTPQFPSQYIGKYFFHDYWGGWIAILNPETKVVSPFLSGLSYSCVDVKVAQDGSLYYVSRSAPGLYRIHYETPVSLSFQVNLEDFAPGGQTVQIELRPLAGSSTVKRTATLDSNGNATLNDVTPLVYDVAVKGARWLREVKQVDLSQGSVSGVTFTLTGGDANNDNSVDVLDLDLLILAFDATPADSNWIPTADFNGDESVDIVDLDILLRNFDRVGEE